MLQATLQACVDTDLRLLTVTPRPGPQGYSGAAVEYFDLTASSGENILAITLVVKTTPLLERQTQTWLARHHLAVPCCYSPDLVSDTHTPLCMRYIEHDPALVAAPQAVAQALAEIHATALGRERELPWLPRADESFIADWLIDGCWRRSWSSLLAGEGHIDAYGCHFGPPKPGGDFAAAFASSTPLLEAAATCLQQTVATLWQAGETLTLIHSDFHRAHLHLTPDGPYLLDWGQAHYGPLYLDLPNYFSRETALHYREALAGRRQIIPEAAFLAGYDAVRAYVGFKYFGIGLYNWCYGDPPHQREAVQYWIDLVLR